MCKGNGRGKWREKAEVAMGNGHAGNADGHRVMGNGHRDSQMEGGRVRTAEVATLAAGLLSLDRPDWQTHFGPHPHLHLYPHPPLLLFFLSRNF